MNRLVKRLWVLGFLLFLTTHASAIQVTVGTNQPEYRVGENLVVLVTAHNPTNQAVTLTFATSHQAEYTMDEFYTPPAVALQVVTYATIPEHGTRTWTIRHSWTAYALEMGQHSLTGTVLNWGEPLISEAVAFSVIAGSPVLKDLLVDFDTLPGSWFPPTTVYDYSPYGVRFGDDGPNFPTLQEDTSGNGNTYLQGKAFKAYLDLAVNTAAFRVSGVDGSQVAVTARNVRGEIIATQLSGPLQGLGEFGAPLTIRATQPIASIEWKASEGNVPVAIDDLYLIVPEPGGFLLMSLLGSLLAYRRGF